MKEVKTHKEGQKWANKQKRAVICMKNGKMYKYFPNKD